MACLSELRQRREAMLLRHALELKRLDLFILHAEKSEGGKSSSKRRCNQPAKTLPHLSNELLLNVLQFLAPQKFEDHAADLLNAELLCWDIKASLCNRRSIEVLFLNLTGHGEFAERNRRTRFFHLKALRGIRYQQRSGYQFLVGDKQSTTRLFSFPSDADPELEEFRNQGAGVKSWLQDMWRVRKQTWNMHLSPPATNDALKLTTLRLSDAAVGLLVEIVETQLSQILTNALLIATSRLQKINISEMQGCSVDLSQSDAKKDAEFHEQLEDHNLQFFSVKSSDIWKARICPDACNSGMRSGRILGLGDRDDPSAHDANEAAVIGNLPSCVAKMIRCIGHRAGVTRLSGCGFDAALRTMDWAFWQLLQRGILYSVHDLCLECNHSSSAGINAQFPEPKEEQEAMEMCDATGKSAFFAAERGEAILLLGPECLWRAADALRLPKYLGLNYNNFLTNKQQDFVNFECSFQCGSIRESEGAGDESEYDDEDE